MNVIVRSAIEIFCIFVSVVIERVRAKGPHQRVVNCSLQCVQSRRVELVGHRLRGKELDFLTALFQALDPGNHLLRG